MKVLSFCNGFKGVSAKGILALFLFAFVSNAFADNERERERERIASA